MVQFSGRGSHYWKEGFIIGGDFKFRREGFTVKVVSPLEGIISLSGGLLHFNGCGFTFSRIVSILGGVVSLLRVLFCSYGGFTLRGWLYF